MTLRDIINKLLRRQPASASTARERLQLVLAHDRSDLSTELLDQMRKEILEVVACQTGRAIQIAAFQTFIRGANAMRRSVLLLGAL